MKGDVSIWRLGSRGETEAAGGMVPIAIYSQGLMPCSLLGSLASAFSLLHQDTHRTHLPGLGHKAGDAADKGQSGQNMRHSHRKQGQEVQTLFSTVGCSQGTWDQSLHWPVSGFQCPSKG